MSAKIALLGAGRIGKVHAQAIWYDPDAELVAVADAFEKAAQAVADQYGCAVRGIEDIAADATIDGVIICTPTNTHADLIELFAKAGKAVFCEKPIDLSITRVRECLDVVKAENATLMLGFNRRFDPHFRALKARVDQGTLGKVEQVTIISRDPGLPPMEYIDVSGGIFRDMTIHDFDMARFLLGEEVVSVQASASVLVDPEVANHGDFDTASVILTTASGRQCTITNSRRASYGYDQRIEVFGEKGLAAAENQRPVSIEVANETGYTRPPLHDFFMTRYTEAYAAEIAAFVATIRDNAAPTPSGQDGLMSLILAEAAVTSVAERRVVDVAEFG
ncbi:inositol 2-dehydrogenase [Shimia abyssi]|uniref:Myo-inositol 2-dehydrogenase n=1 Tax=Shimia abyssi TaxID=1662395 RepID=A0A2P8FA94_9RHOB|nr:inositol 2-dehydrogenase [Shimia abyssi]PSL18635.1 myo-inositol 2-dehydrogenase [Shimia abyssi]